MLLCRKENVYDSEIAAKYDNSTAISQTAKTQLTLQVKEEKKKMREMWHQNYHKLKTKN